MRTRKIKADAAKAFALILTASVAACTSNGDDATSIGGVSLAPAGTHAKFGSALIVPAPTATDPAALNVTVTSVSAANVRSLQDFFPVSGSPWFVRARIENPTGAAFVEPSDGIYGVLDDGSQASPVATNTPVTTCSSIVDEKVFSHKGASLTTCRIVLVPAGKRLVGAYYAADVAGFGTYLEKPVTWTASGDVPTG